MSEDEAPSHRELLDMLAAAREAVGLAHQYVDERRPPLDGSGFGHTPVAWRCLKAGSWAFRPHGAEPPPEVLVRFGWEALYTRPTD